jgi:hypothetical protein
MALASEIHERLVVRRVPSALVCERGDERAQMDIMIEVQARASPHGLRQWPIRMQHNNAASTCRVSQRVAAASSRMRSAAQQHCGARTAAPHGQPSASAHYDSKCVHAASRATPPATCGCGRCGAGHRGRCGDVRLSV